MKRIATVVLWAWALRAGDEKPAKPELTASVRAVVDLARAAPPELFAETIDRLVETGRIPGRELQIELLDDAFAAATRAKEPWRLIAIPPTPLDTRAMYRSKAGELHLDAVSLESRILAALLTVDPAHARELFDHVSHPLIDPRPCEDPLVADVSAYYDMAGAIVQSTFTAAQKSKDVHVQYLTAMLAAIRSPVELAPFARSLRSIALSPQQLQLLAASFAGKLESIVPDYRAFAVSLPELQVEVAGFPGSEVSQAFRTYVRHQMAAARCLPDFGPSIHEIEGMGDAEIQPSKREGAIQAETYFQTGDGTRIGEALTRLRATPVGVPESQDAALWRNQLADFLRDFTAWRPAGSSIDVLHQRATVWRALLEMTPRGDDRDRLVKLSVAFLESSDAVSQSPAEWLYQVKMLQDGAGPDAPKMLDAFRASGSVGLSVYAAMRGSL